MNKDFVMSRLSIAEKKNNPYCGLNKAIGGTIRDLSEKKDSNSFTIAGFLHTTNFLDSDKDVTIKGYAVESINKRWRDNTTGNKIKYLQQHDWSKVIGAFKELEEGESMVNGKMLYGIKYVADIPKSQAMLIDLIQNGGLDAHSIGFQYEELVFASKSGNSDDMNIYNRYAPMVENLTDNDDSFWIVSKINLFKVLLLAWEQMHKLLLLMQKGVLILTMSIR